MYFFILIFVYLFVVEILRNIQGPSIFLGGCYGIGGPLESRIFRESCQHIMVYRVVVREVMTTGL